MDVGFASMHRRTEDPTFPLHKIGRFDGIRLRGKGGFGVVFEAIDPTLQRRVALKLCEVRGPDDANDMFKEARMLAKLSHPNIVAVYEADRWGDDVFFVMEYIDGPTAHDFALRNPAPSWQEVVDIFVVAGEGLAAAHDHDPPIVHGDFKPANVLLDAEAKRPRVADFGLARIRIENAPEAEREQVRQRGGTVPFMAPELLRGEDGDARSDQWSFCVALWCSLDRALPFVAESSDRMLEAITLNEPRCVRASVPEQLREVLRRGLSIDPDERFADMHELLRALALVRRMDPPSVPDDPEAELVALLSLPARRPRKVPPWAVIGLLVVGALAVAWVVREQAQTDVSAQPRPVCAVEDPEQALRGSVVDVCRKIRLGKFEDAWNDWAAERSERFGEDEVALAEDTLIIARTLAEEAERLELVDAALTRRAVDDAELWMTKVEPVLGKAHAGVAAVNERLGRLP